MKKNISVLLMLGISVGCMMLTGCKDQKTITLEEIGQITKTEEMLKKHSSFQVTMSEGENNSTITRYVDKEMVSYEYPEGSVFEGSVLYLDNQMEYAYNGEKFARAVPVFQELLQLKENLIYAERTEETIKKSEKKDGKIYIFSETSEDQTKECLEADGYTWNEGDYFRCEYCIDANTEEILSIHEDVVSTDGTTRKYIYSDIEYDVQRPDFATELYEHSIATENADPEDLCTATVISDPDTENEKSCSIQKLKGDMLILMKPEGYTTNFMDRACTEKVTTIDYDKDVTMYIAKGK